MQDLLNTVPTYMDIELDDSGPTVAVGATAPADTTGLWIDIPAVPNPPQAMVYYPPDGWIKPYTGQPDEVRIIVENPHPLFETSGLGRIGSAWEGWALCNGANGTLNLQNKFVVPGYTYDDNGNWLTNIGSLQDSPGGSIGGGANVSFQPTDLNTGGFVNFQINLWNLPGITVLVSFGGNYESGGHNQSAPTGTDANPITIPFTSEGGMVQALVSRLPPYVAVGYAQFIGY
jgi:hypothetical protein